MALGSGDVDSGGHHARWETRGGEKRKEGRGKMVGVAGERRRREGPRDIEKMEGRHHDNLRGGVLPQLGKSNCTKSVEGREG